MHAYQMNGLKAINTHFDGNFEIDTITTSAVWSAERERIEILLKFHETQTVSLKSLNFEETYERGTRSLTHIMRKMTSDVTVDLIETNGLKFRKAWTDAKGWSAIILFEF